MTAMRSCPAAIVSARTRWSRGVSSSRKPVTSPAARSFDDAVHACTRCHEHVDDVRHPEDAGVQQCRSTGNAARVVRRDRLDVRPGLDQHTGDIGVAVARCGNECRLTVFRIAVHARARSEQHTCNIAGALDVLRQPEPFGVEPQHRDIAERCRTEWMIAPVLELRQRELGALGEKRADSPEIAAREGVPPLDRGGKRGPVREVVTPGERVAVAGVRGQVVQPGWSEPGGKTGHGYMPIAWYPLST